MNGLFAAAEQVQDLCRQEGWSFCFIGGLAVQRWGEPRMTRDVDLTLLADFGEEAGFVERLTRRFEARVEDAAKFALRTRVVLLRTAEGVPIDVALGALPFEERTVQRATDWPVPGPASLRTCSAEDLVVHKTLPAGTGTGPTWWASSRAAASGSIGSWSRRSSHRCWS